MIHNITRNSTYNYSITYEKPQSKLKDWGGTKALVEKNDADNDAYRNAVTKATMIAEDVRYSQGGTGCTDTILVKKMECYLSQDTKEALRNMLEIVNEIL